MARGADEKGRRRQNANSRPFVGAVWDGEFGPLDQGLCARLENNDGGVEVMLQWLEVRILS